MNNISDNNAVKIAVRERPALEHINHLQTSVITYHPNGSVSQKQCAYICLSLTN